MNLFKTIENKKKYLNSKCDDKSTISFGRRDFWSRINLNKKMFCTSCEKPFKIGDYLVRLKQNGSKFDEVITCAEHDCDGDFTDWVIPETALDLLNQIYEEEDLTIPEKVYYNALIRIMEKINSDCEKQDNG